MRADECGRSAVHSLYVRFDRQTQGRSAYHRRICRLDRNHLPLHLRLSRRRGFLVHCRYRVGHRAQLHRLRSAAEWGDRPDVRRRSELSRSRPLLGRMRKAQGQHLLHCPNRDPRADARGRHSCYEARPVIASLAGQRWRTDQSRGMALVLRDCRRGETADRRHLVADRNRRLHDHYSAWRARHETGQRGKAFLRCLPATGRQ